MQIDTQRCLFKDSSISNLGIDELNRLKRHVKNELKRYDQTFVSLFYCQPSKSDKEPLRPLYMFYKRLKQLITKKEQGGDRRGAEQNSSNRGKSEASSTMNLSEVASRSGSVSSSVVEPKKTASTVAVP